MNCFHSNHGRPARRLYAQDKVAFSLVEVVVAMGVAVFALVSVVALLPTGLKSASESIDESRAINILSGVVADRMATPFSTASKIYQLPALTNTLQTTVTNYFGINNDDQNTGTDLKQARYRVDYRIVPPQQDHPDPYQAWLKVSWPARSTNFVGSVEVFVAFPQP